MASVFLPLWVYEDELVFYTNVCRATVVDQHSILFVLCLMTHAKLKTLKIIKEHVFLDLFI